MIQLGVQYLREKNILYVLTHIVFTNDQCFFYLHKITCRGCVLESPRRGDSTRRFGEAILIHIHTILFYGEMLKIITFYHFDSDPRFSPFLLHVYVMFKSGVTFVGRCFRDGMARELQNLPNHQCCSLGYHEANGSGIIGTRLTKWPSTTQWYHNVCRALVSVMTKQGTSLKTADAN